MAQLVLQVRWVSLEWPVFQGPVGPQDSQEHWVILDNLDRMVMLEHLVQTVDQGLKVKLDNPDHQDSLDSLDNQGRQALLAHKDLKVFEERQGLWASQVNLVLKVKVGLLDYPGIKEVRDNLDKTVHPETEALQELTALQGLQVIREL